jgi:ferric-dicitrate binding protein FerR (iron transport regulator)
MDGAITAGQLEELERALGDDAAAREQFLREMNIHAAIEDTAIDMAPTAMDTDDLVSRGAGDTHLVRRNPMTTGWALLAASVALLALATTMFFSQPAGAPKIATITGLSGPLLWTGDGGRVVQDLNVGLGLVGGTIEGMTPDAWFELEFNDGSTVTISGNSMLTFSDDGQKNLRLKEGAFSANVTPQPKGKPMLIRTRSALFEVVGTRFSIDAGPAASTLTVNEGMVLATRLSDGVSVETTSKLKVVVSADQALTPTPVPDSVHSWMSQLQRGPKWTRGEWVKGEGDQDAQLKTIPYTTESGKTIYTASFRVSSGDNPPVVLSPDSRIRVRGAMTSLHPLYVGVTLRDSAGDFGGRFQIIQPPDEFAGGHGFEIVLQLSDYRLDPSLKHIQDKLPNDLFGLTVNSIWCHTLDKQAGLTVTSIEILGPDGG